MTTDITSLTQQIEQIEQLIGIVTARLYVYEQQIAMFGMCYAPAHIVIEKQNAELDLARYRATLAKLRQHLASATTTITTTSIPHADEAERFVLESGAGFPVPLSAFRRQIEPCDEERRYCLRNRKCTRPIVLWPRAGK